MAEPKTKLTDEKVEDFLNRIPEEQKRKDSFALMELMKAVSKCEPRMWGTAIVGYGTYTYRYANGKELDWPLIGFSPRKQSLVLYIDGGFEKWEELKSKLGPNSYGKCCLYIKRLSDIDMPTLKKIVTASFKHSKKVLT